MREKLSWIGISEHFMDKTFIECLTNYCTVMYGIAKIKTSWRNFRSHVHIITSNGKPSAIIYKRRAPGYRNVCCNDEVIVHHSTPWTCDRDAVDCRRGYSAQCDTPGLGPITDHTQVTYSTHLHVTVVNDSENQRLNDMLIRYQYITRK